MANDVFANGREISCKRSDSKTICNFPDVCMTPPECPATPPGVPVPYPNTGMAKDTTLGSKSVKFSGEEVMIRNKSCYKTSYGDEAGCATQKGVITSKITGKVYFTSWSTNVKIEGQNAVRHLDLTTHNHGTPANAALPKENSGKSATPSLNPKPCKKTCPKEPTKEKYEEVRNKGDRTPSDKIKRDINTGKNRICFACKIKFPNLEADHIVSLKVISKMPGFACLGLKDQQEVANFPHNFIGMCHSCNSSKREKTWHQWKGHKKRKLIWTDELRIPFQQKTDRLLRMLETKIRSFECL